VNAGTLSLTGSFPSSAVMVNGGTFDSAGAQTNVLSLSINGGGASVSAGALKVGNGTATTPLQTGGGKLDLKSNGVIVDHPDFDAPSELVSVRQQIINAYNPSAPGAGDGNWQGANGIGSSLLSTPAGANKAIGYATSAELLGASGGTFMGQTVDGSAVLARYTFAGDANLSGKVDFTDLVALAQNYGSDFNANPTTDSWWTHGDFNYDGKVNFTDLVKLAQNYGAALPADAIPGASLQFDADLAAAFAQVPEPATLGGIAILALGCTCRRRQRRAR
jgi:Dockerin type I domain